MRSNAGFTIGRGPASGRCQQPAASLILWGNKVKTTGCMRVSLQECVWPSVAKPLAEAALRFTPLGKTPMTELLLLIARLLGGAVNSLAGGASFIVFPALVFAGVPAVIANASTTYAALPG